MEIKITLKNGGKSSTFKFAGEPIDVISGIGKQFADVVGNLRKWIDPVDNAQ